MSKWFNLTKTGSEIEKNTFKYHFIYSLIEGIIAGVIVLNEFVFLKGMHGSNYQLGFLFQFSVIVFLFAVVLKKIFKNLKSNKKILRVTALITRLPLIALIFFPRDLEIYKTNGELYHYAFIIILFIYFFASPIIFPIINSMLKSNYTHQNFSKFYSYSSSANKIIMMITTFVYGILLDNNNYLFVFVFPIIAVLGIISVYILSKIENLHEGLPNVLNKSSQNHLSLKTILKNKAFRGFEIGFMFYGFTFMVTTPVIAIFFSDVLNLNYSSIAFYKNSYNILAIIMLPFFGRLLGNIDPRKFAAITFSSYLLYILFISLSQFFQWNITILGIQLYLMLIIAYIFNGVFAATMSLLWNIGSAYFCKKEEAGEYQTAHLYLTGVRGLIAPLAGIYFYEAFGFFVTFMIGIASISFAVIYMRISMKN